MDRNGGGDRGSAGQTYIHACPYWKPLTVTESSPLGLVFPCAISYCLGGNTPIGIFGYVTAVQCFPHSNILYNKTPGVMPLDTQSICTLLLALCSVSGCVSHTTCSVRPLFSGLKESQGRLAVGLPQA